MKAKEYAERWISEGKTEVSLDVILVCFWKEILPEATRRRISSGKAEIALIRELDNKWRAFARHFPDEVSQEEFRIFYSRQTFLWSYSLEKIKDHHSMIWPNKPFPQEEIKDYLNQIASNIKEALMLS